MSFIKPRWLDDLIRPAASASPRVRGLKAFEPHHVPAFQDVLYADDPIFWIAFGSAAVNGLNLSYVGIQVPADDTMLVVVDRLIFDGLAGSLYVVEVAIPPLTLSTDSNVFKLNRREQSRSAGIERAGLLRIVDNIHVTTGQTIASAQVPANNSGEIKLGIRLFGNEQLYLRGAAGVAVEATLFGRLTTKGQR